MHVSVVIPAYNAAETLGEALTSLRSQIQPDWEAIVVDDGSRDRTVTIAETFAACDARILPVSQPHMGASAARNTGISLARSDWLLFLDADDWLSPLHLQRMTGALVADPKLDGVHCGWARVTPEGQLIDKAYRQPDDLFALLARRPAFVIHACIVRRSLVEAVGGFDPSLRTCEDWDLWQRIARAGAHLGAIDDVLAFYRMRPASASLEGRQMLVDGLRVISQGFSSDARVPQPKPEYANGLSADDLAGTMTLFACWCAGLALGCGEQALPLLDVLKDDYWPRLDPSDIADSIFTAAVLPRCRPLTAWEQLWSGIKPHLDEFLQALETRALAPGLARRTYMMLHRLTLEHSTAHWPLTLGALHAVRVELTEPILDILPPTPAERLHCSVELEGTRLGALELPICDGIVPSYVLVDAIAAEFAWPILGRYFERTVYRDLRIEREPNGMSLWRGSCRLAGGRPAVEPFDWQQVHNNIGWAVFLQELWGCPEKPSGWFYRADRHASSRRYTWSRLVRAFQGRSSRFQAYCRPPSMLPRHRLDQDWMTVEVSDQLPDLESAGPLLDVLLTVGGVALGIATLPVEHKFVGAHELRVALTKAGGMELCRAAVREGLLGRPMVGHPSSLRARLAAAAAVHGRVNALAPESAVDGELMRAAAYVRSQTQLTGGCAMVLGRRAYRAFETSVSRRAMLPAAAARELLESAAVAGAPVVRLPGLDESPDRVIYAPDLICHRLPPTPASATGGQRLEKTRPAETATYGRSYFETLFAARPDPWGYTTPYEQTKYAQTLALLPSDQITRALELACAEGHFTVQLAPLVGSLVAGDISDIALSRAADRCVGMENVRFVHLDLTKDPLPGSFELIVCSEALYYCVDKVRLRTVAHKLADALQPGGYLLTAHANLVVDDPDHAGFDWDCPFGAKVIGQVLANTRPLRLVKEIRTPLYRIQLFRHQAGRLFPFRRSTPEVIEVAPSAPLLPDMASRILWSGGRPRDGGVPQPVVTDRLPILMYHRVAPTGSASMTRYRVSPETFEQQLGYLRDAGYYSVSLEEWRAVVEAKKPLAGRGVLITFDDGYRDFLTHAWPRLRRYGFKATVFLVTDAIGQSNAWDRVYGEEVPLLGWKELHRLACEGVEFGSHSAGHRFLTALSPVDVVREGTRSKAILERRLGRPINAFAYPYGDTDQVVQHLIGACGYIFGLSTRRAQSRFEDSLLALPRIEVTGADRFQDFIAKLAS
jgi:peptidoglycan/xylan/chitin deacetylase (PgdA/CDA1 family)/SAM-dependent methyltransferase